MIMTSRLIVPVHKAVPSKSYPEETFMTKGTVPTARAASVEVSSVMTKVSAAADAQVIGLLVASVNS